jgi:hypothetical protein
MDRSWINATLFSKPHLEGDSEFMKLVTERFNANEEILCPCRKCLNRLSGHRVQVKDHLYLHGMASTYTRWMYHGEAMDDIINENGDQQDEHVSFNEDAGMNQDEDLGDMINGMVEELYTAEDEDKRKSMFGDILEEMKQELYPSATYTRFLFVVKLLHIKSFYRISNVGFTTILKLLKSAFPNCSLHLLEMQINLSVHWDLGMFQSMCA